MEKNIIFWVCNLSFEEYSKLRIQLLDYGENLESGHGSVLGYAIKCSFDSLQNAIQFVSDVSCDENYESPKFEINWSLK